jgi:2-dehydro-3-deoxygluconokinase
MVDWDSVFTETKAFHVTGITPALTKNTAEATKEALSKAKKAGLLISFDLNYRSHLWTTKQANSTLAPLMKYVDIFMATEEDAPQVLQVKGKGCEEIAQNLAASFGFKAVTITLGSAGMATEENLAAITYHNGHLYKEQKYEIQAIDRIGAGDAFAGAFLYVYLSSQGDVEKALKYSVAASALKHSLPGDINWCTKEDVERLIDTGGSRKVSR